MKKLLIGIMLLLFISYAYAEDITISYTIPGAKAQKALEGFIELYPNIELNEQGKPKYTNKEWVVEKIRRLIVKDIERGLKMKSIKEVTVEKDDSILSSK